MLKLFLGPGSMPKLLEKFTSSIKDYEEFKEIIPLSVDTIVVMLNNVAEKTDIELAKTALTSAKNLLRVIIAAIEKNRIVSSKLNVIHPCHIFNH